MMETQATPEVRRKGGSMPEWAMFRWFTSDVNHRRFITRFILLRTPFISLDVSRIHKDDRDRPHPHDHSRSFASLKFGSYDEWVYYDPTDLSKRRFRSHRRFSLHLLRYTQAHSITRVSPRLITVLFLGPRHQESTYWTPTGKVLTGVNPGKK